MVQYQLIVSIEGTVSIDATDIDSWYDLLMVSIHGTLPIDEILNFVSIE